MLTWSGELLHLLLFLLASLIAYHRSNLPDFQEKGVYLRGSLEGDVIVESGYAITRISVGESELEEIEGREATLKVYGSLPKKAREVALFGDVSVKDNKVFIYAKGNEIEVLPERGSLRELLMERYVRNSSDKGVVPLGLSFLFGQPTGLLPSEVQRNFLSTGLVHLLVVSGLHVGTIALVLTKMLPRFWGMRLALLGVLLYTLFVVPTKPPILRASLMLSLALLSLLTFRRPNTLAILLFSGSVLLTLRPHYVFSYSFWLSFTATAYILLSLRGLEASVWKKTLVASASAFTGVAPLISTFSWISPISIILTPILSPVVLAYSFFGVLSLITFMSFPPFVDLFNLVGKLFEKTVALASLLSFNLYPRISPYEGAVLSLFGAILLYFLRGRMKLLPLLLINLYLLTQVMGP